jgi:hypothetical protein
MGSTVTEGVSLIIYIALFLFARRVVIECKNKIKDEENNYGEVDKS